MSNTELLEQICENCNQNYCTAREIMRYKGQNSQDCSHLKDEHSHCPNLKYISQKVSERLALQFKCIEELKWIKCQELGREITWDQAGMMWVEEGFAKVFADVWNSGKRDIYFFFKAGTVPERKKYSHPIEIDLDPEEVQIPVYSSGSLVPA